ncbi:MAG: globin [Planctomycetota bacterium]
MSDNDQPQTLYQILGAGGFDRLTRGFYEAVPTDDILGPMYRGYLARMHDVDEDNDQAMTLHFEEARLRLRDFLIQRFGGPATYSDQRGHPRLRMRHMPFRIDHAAAERWLELMFASLDDMGLEPNPYRELRVYFTQTALFMVNR